MIPVGRRGQEQNDDLWTFDGSIAEGGVAQLVLPIQPRRAFLQIENTSATHDLFVGIGPATATATVTSGKIASVAVNNGGIGYTVVPQVRFLGGIVDGDYNLNPTSYAPNYPFKPAVAVAALSGGAVSTITVLDGGYGYLVAPYVYLENTRPYLGGGAFEPSATAGIWLEPAGSVTYDTACPWSAVAVFGGTTEQTYVVKVLIS